MADNDKLTETVGTLAKTVGTLAETVGTLTKNVDALIKNIGVLAETVGALGKRVNTLTDNVEALTETVTFIKDHMVTKEELKEQLEPINYRLISVEKKVEGLYKLNDGEVQKRVELG